MPLRRNLDRRLKLHHLRGVDEIAKQRSLLRAAAALGISQPALTKSLHELEGIVQLLIANGWSAYGANFLVGIVIAAIGGIAVYLAVKGLSAKNLMPSRTIDQLGKDAHLVKEQAR